MDTDAAIDLALEQVQNMTQAEIDAVLREAASGPLSQALNKMSKFLNEYFPKGFYEQIEQSTHQGREPQIEASEEGIGTSEVRCLESGRAELQEQTLDHPRPQNTYQHGQAYAPYRILRKRRLQGVLPDNHPLNRGRSWP